MCGGKQKMITGFIQAKAITRKEEINRTCEVVMVDASDENDNVYDEDGGALKQWTEKELECPHHLHKYFK